MEFSHYSDLLHTGVYVRAHATDLVGGHDRYTLSVEVNRY